MSKQTDKQYEDITVKFLSEMAGVRASTEDYRSWLAWSMEEIETAISAAEGDA